MKRSSILIAIAVLVLVVIIAVAMRSGGKGGEATLAGDPITIVVPFNAGGPTDKVARDLAIAMQKQIPGSSFVVENVNGAGGTIGAAKVKNAKPDGHYLLLYHIGMATSATLYRNLPFNVANDFEFLGMVNDVPMTIIGRSGLEAKNIKELIDWIKASGDKVNLADAGLGAASNLCGMLLQSALQTKMTVIPYTGTGPAMTALLANQVDVMCDQSTNTTAQIEGGKVKAYAVTTPQRLTTPALKDLPTLDESGLKGVQVTIWHGLYAPKGTPEAVTRALNTALKAALKDADFMAKQAALGAVVVTDDRLEPAGHKKFVLDEINKWAPLIKAAGKYAD